MRLSVDVRRFPGVRRLAADYAHDFRAVASFFAGDPSQPADWAAAITRARQHARRRSEIAAILAGQQRRRGAPAAAQAAAAELASSDTVAILTGQQAGLFGGPLFTLLKALTALRLAEQTARDHRVRVVAIFWVEAEDHDWDEVRQCTVFDRNLEPRTVALPPREGDPTPVAGVALDASVTAAIDELAGLLPATEFTGPLLDALRSVYVPGAGMADAFARWLEQVLGPRGLIVYDASDAASKPLVAEVFARELAMPGQTARLAASTGAALVSHGYHAQVQAHDDQLALFRLDGARRAIRHENGELWVGDQAISRAALLEEAGERPARFSPGVLLRPIVQDTLFPTVCYVAGPNELAYLGQLRPVYEHFGVPMPLMYPRASATLIDAAALRFLTRYQLPLEALHGQDDAALHALLEAEIPRPVEEAFAAAGEAVERTMTRLAAAMPALDPTLEGAVRTTLGRMQHDLGTLRSKMIQAAKRRHDTIRRQFAHARALAFPQGHSQERTIAFVWFLNQYGPVLVDRLYDELPLEMGRHWVISL